MPHSDSGTVYLLARGFVQQMGTFYYPSANYPHLHAGLTTVSAGVVETTVVRIDERTGLPRPPRTGLQEYTFETLSFISYHLAGEARAKHIWSSDGGWSNRMRDVARELNAAGLFPVCQAVVNAFAVTRDTAPAEIRI